MDCRFMAQFFNYSNHYFFSFYIRWPSSSKNPWIGEFALLEYCYKITFFFIKIRVTLNQLKFGTFYITCNGQYLVRTFSVFIMAVMCLTLKSMAKTVHGSYGSPDILDALLSAVLVCWPGAPHFPLQYTRRFPCHVLVLTPQFNSNSTEIKPHSFSMGFHFW